MYALSVHTPFALALFGPKTAETRTHNQFRRVVGKPIAIHATLTRKPWSIDDAVALGWDADDLLEYWPHLFNAVEGHADTGVPLTVGAVLGTAFVRESRPLNSGDSKAAMVDCSAGNRYGLFLSKRRLFPEPIPCKGQQGLWFWDEPSFVRRNGYFPETP